MVCALRFLCCGLAAALLILPRGLARGSEPSPQLPSSDSSLGERARELRAKASQQAKKAKRVYTNDDLRGGSEGISVLGGSSLAGASSGPAELATEEHNEQYYHRSMNELQARRELHQRELEVLKQKLSINQLQYYSDPYKTLLQEYSRSDINKLQQEIEAKAAEVKADEQTIADLQAQLRREGGDPGWLRSAPGRRMEKQTAGTESEEAGETLKGQPGTREYWEGRFKSARAKLARARERQQLTEDELSLLQVRQAREPNAAAELEQKIDAKQAEVESARAATHDAETALEALQKEFAASGAPEEWSREP